MLPYLRNNKETGMVDSEETVERKPDRDNFDIFDALADDMLKAVERRDKDMLKSVLAALCTYLENRDEDQDQNMMGA